MLIIIVGILHTSCDFLQENLNHEPSLSVKNSRPNFSRSKFQSLANNKKTKDLKILVGKNFSQRPKIQLPSADFFFADKIFQSRGEGVQSPPTSVAIKMNNQFNWMDIQYKRRRLSFTEDSSFLVYGRPHQPKRSAKGVNQHNFMVLLWLYERFECTPQALQQIGIAWVYMMRTRDKSVRGRSPLIISD